MWPFIRNLVRHKRRTALAIALTGLVTLMGIGLYASVVYLTNDVIRYGCLLETLARKDVRILSDARVALAYWEWQRFIHKVIAAAILSICTIGVLAIIVLALPSAPSPPSESS